MKVVVTAQGQDLEAMVDPRFGRCQYFLFIDTESMRCEAEAYSGRCNSETPASSLPTAGLKQW